MTENSDGIPAIDFVAKDIKNNRICVNGINDKFTAIKNHGKWKKGYPEFDDLMDYFSEEKNLSEIQKFSSEARNSIQNQFKPIGKKSQDVKLNTRKKSNSRKANLPVCLNHICNQRKSLRPGSIEIRVIKSTLKRKSKISNPKVRRAPLSRRTTKNYQAAG